MTEKQYLLNSEGLENCLTFFDSIDDKYFIDNKQRLKARLIIENILINNQNFFGEDIEFVFKCRERFQRTYFSIEVRGESYDSRMITDIANEDLEIILMRMMGTFEKSPSYQYKNGCNIVSMSLRRVQRFGPVRQMLLAVLSGLVLSILGLAFPVFFKDIIVPICEQIGSIILGLIKMTVVPVVFLMVVKSINGCGSIATIKKSGINVIKWYCIRYAFLTFMLLMYFFFMFDFSFSDSTQGKTFLDAIMEVVKGLFPTSYVNPFAEGNFLQIIVIAFAIGIAVLVIGQPAEPFVKLCQSMDHIFSQVMEWCCDLLPVYVALVVPTIIWSDKLSLISGLLVHFVGAIVMQCIVTHFNHPRELTEEAIQSLRILRESGCVIRNQTVLLKGVNDSEKTLAMLMNSLVSVGVIPYYIFQCRPASGVKNQFQVPITRAADIIDRARLQMDGQAKGFRFIMSHRTGKIEILGNTEQGVLFKYHQPKQDVNNARFVVKELGPEVCWLDEI